MSGCSDFSDLESRRSCVTGFHRTIFRPIVPHSLLPSISFSLFSASRFCSLRASICSVVFSYCAISSEAESGSSTDVPELHSANLSARNFAVASDLSIGGGVPFLTCSQKSASSFMSIEISSSSRSTNFHLNELPPMRTAIKVPLKCNAEFAAYIHRG